MKKINFDNVNTYCSYTKFNGTFSYYIDGEESIKSNGIIIEDPDFFDQNIIRQNLRLGNYLEDEIQSFGGKITDVNIWSTGLSRDEIITWSDCKWDELKTNPDISMYCQELNFG